MTRVDMTDLDAFRSALRLTTAMVWIETPTNPTLKIVDIKALSAIAHTAAPDAIVVVDNTFLSPVLQVGTKPQS